MNVQHILHSMNRTGHMGVEFLHEGHISSYGYGTHVSMGGFNVEDRLTNIHDDGRHIARLFATYLFPRRFANYHR